MENVWDSMKHETVYVSCETFPHIFTVTKLLWGDWETVSGVKSISQMKRKESETNSFNKRCLLSLTDKIFL